MTTDTTTEPYVTDGGLETDLIFNHGTDLPDFAAFPLVDSETGRARLSAYFDDYAAIAEQAGHPLLLETPTWRASSDWGTRLGYDAAALDHANRACVELVHETATRWSGRVPALKVSGQIGPRGDGYRPGATTVPEDAAAYHRPQVASLHAAGADIVTALTLTGVGEAIGIAMAATDVGIPYALGFTVETDGRLPDGTTVAAAVAAVAAVDAVDAVTPPEYFLLNCAHPSHIDKGVDDGAWRDRIRGLRVNASALSHAELDESEELDAGDPARLAEDVAALRVSLPAVGIVGGCCGTDARHVAAMWGVAV